MIKANVILDYSKWKNKIKDPDSYLKKKLRKLSKIPYFQKKKQEFSILLTNNKKMKNLNFKFRKKNKTTDILSENYKYEIIKYICKYISIFHTIHEDENELALFTNDICKISF